MGASKQRMCLWVNDKDRMRLELIREVFGVSLSGAIRVAIRAASEKLGLEKETAEDFIGK